MISSPNEFLITSLPRCRTAWLTNLFLTERTHCFHILSASHDYRAMRWLFEKTGKEYVGICEPDLVALNRVNYFSAIDKTIPVVVINRNIDDSLDACFMATSFETVEEQTKLMDERFELLQFVKQEFSNVLSFDFTNLTTENVCKIWDHCVPSIKIDLMRVKQLQEFNIVTKCCNPTSLHRYRQMHINLSKE